MNFVGIGNVDSTFDLWFNTVPNGPKVLIWRMAFIALLKAIWRIRNKVVFQHESFDNIGYLEMYRFDLAWWVKAKWGKNVPSIID